MDNDLDGSIEYWDYPYIQENVDWEIRYFCELTVFLPSAFLKAGVMCLRLAPFVVKQRSTGSS